MTHPLDNHIATLENRIKKGDRSVKVAGISGAALSYFFSRFLKQLENPCVVVLPKRKDAELLLRELGFFSAINGQGHRNGCQGMYEYPPYDMTPLTGLSPHMEVISRRLEALYALMTEKRPVIVTSVEAVSFKTLPKSSLAASLEYLEVGEDVERDDLLKRLEDMGYQRSSLVEARGDYSVRGGVIDLFPPLYDLPLRIEFWGDHVESIRAFDALSQRSQEDVKEISILPSSEIIRGEENIKRARSMGRLPVEGEFGRGFPGQEAWMNHFYPCLDSLFDYIPDNGVLALFEPHRFEAVSKGIEKKFDEDLERFRKESSTKGKPFPVAEGCLIGSAEMSAYLQGIQRLEFSQLGLTPESEDIPGISIKGNFSSFETLDIAIAGKGRISLAPLAEKVSTWVGSGARVVIVSRTMQQANRIGEILENYDVRVDETVQNWSRVSGGAGITVCLGRLSKGFTWPDIGLYIISEDEIFGPKSSSRPRKRRASENVVSWSSFSQLRNGDFVVHEDHGIGRYGGLIKMEVENKANDFVIIEYADRDRLYVPADRLSILQKYAGADEGDPRVDLLGGRSWKVAKQKARKSVKRIAKQLVEIYALRKYRSGFSFSPPDGYFREFEATFAYEETNDQLKAIDDVLEDMSSERPMDRLICGDVGFGKTEVALRAAFKAVSDGKQVAILVPTTVLAEQHYETFRSRMAPFSVRVGLMSRFRARKDQSEVAGKVRAGKIDVLVGTHRILQKDVGFRDLGLLIIDEEQRFGVKQKELLKKYRSLVDVLAITATPVPRTLHLSMMGVRDISIIETPPEDRQAVETYLSPYDDALVIRSIQTELERNGQVFFVHNRVKDIGAVADHLRELMPDVRFAVAHGQMKEKDLEKTMMHFLEKQIDVLVCTTIIESGLDIPSANTIIIDRVERLGLAQIYQLRGRVGRSKEKAYAYLLLSVGSTLTKDAEKRLRALMDFSHLGAGLHLAMHDLKIRGGGNILGFAQSGHISAVGYEMYLKFIERAVSELKGEERYEHIDPEINADIAAFLPEDYIIDTDVRLNIYRRLSTLREKIELETISREIRDRFGILPEEAENLLALMALRLMLRDLGIRRLDIGRNSFVLTFSEDGRVKPDKLVEAVAGKPNGYRFISQNRLKISMVRLSLPGDLRRIEESINSLNLQ